MSKISQDKADYLSAVASSYLLMGMNIIAQVLLVPIYLDALGKYQFGVLMLILAFVNYAVIGIGFMSSGSLRLLGECFANQEVLGFQRTFTVTKYIFVGYALLVGILMVVIAGIFFDDLFHDAPVEMHSELMDAIISAAIYFILRYDFVVECLAFTAMGKQAVSNLLQFISIFIFAALVVPWLYYKQGTLADVFWCMSIGVLMARTMSWLYWKKVGQVWNKRPGLFRGSLDIVKRLLGPMGGGYFIYGMFVLTLQADVLIVGFLGGAKLAAEFVLLWKIAEVGIQVIAKIPEQIAPFLIHMDTRQEASRLWSTYQRLDKMLLAAALLLGLAYAFFGHNLVALWVGEAQAPDLPLGYMLAGAAIFWLSIAKLPAIYASSLVRLKALNKVAGLELLIKIFLIVVLFPVTEIVSPLLAISIVHIFGVASCYRRLAYNTGGMKA